MKRCQTELSEPRCETALVSLHNASRGERRGSESSEKHFQASRCELDPNNKQRTLFAKHAGAARVIWNWGLTDRKKRFSENEGKEKFISFIGQNNYFNKIKHETLPWITEISSTLQLWVLRSLDKSFRDFWKARKSGKKLGFPKLKKKNKCRDSFTLSTARVEGRHIVLPKIRSVRLKEKPKPIEGKIKHATISRESDRWYVSILVEVSAPALPITPPGKPVGVDLGIKCFAVVSDGRMYDAPRPLEKNLRKLKRFSRNVSRKQKGSNSRRKAAMRLARLYRRTHNIRVDFNHKLSTKLAKSKSVIAVEDLNVKGMMENRCLSRRISDLAWGEFLQQLKYKTVKFGSRLIVADRWFASSKTCSRCGWKKEDLTLSDRVFLCGDCKLRIDRDLNAARNLENLSVAVDPTDTQNACGEKSSGAVASATA